MTGPHNGIAPEESAEEGTLIEALPRRPAFPEMGIVPGRFHLLEFIQLELICIHSPPPGFTQPTQEFLQMPLAPLAFVTSILYHQGCWMPSQ